MSQRALGPQFGPHLLPEKVTGHVPLDQIVGPRGVQSKVNDLVHRGVRVSDTPDTPIMLKLRPGADPALYEIGDGHHRVAAAMLRGETSVRANVWHEYDDEPYTDPELLSQARVPR